MRVFATSLLERSAAFPNHAAAVVVSEETRGAETPADAVSRAPA